MVLACGALLAAGCGFIGWNLLLQDMTEMLDGGSHVLELLV